MKTTKIPKKLPVWLVKAMWAGTAVKMRISARNEIDAWNAAWKKVAKLDGGDMCLNVVVEKRVN